MGFHFLKVFCFQIVFAWLWKLHYPKRVGEVRIVRFGRMLGGYWLAAWLAGVDRGLGGRGRVGEGNVFSTVGRPSPVCPFV